MAFAIVHSQTGCHRGFTVDAMTLPAGWELREVTRQVELAASAFIDGLAAQRAGREVFVVWSGDTVREATAQEAGDAGLDREEVQRRIDAVWDACETAFTEFVADRRTAKAQAFIDRFEALRQQRSRVTGLGARG